MRGVWLNQNSSAAAMGKTVPTFAKFKPSLKQRDTKGNRLEFFIPKTLMTLKMQKYYKDEMVDYDADAVEVENILGDISDQENSTNSTNDELTAARLENLKARTLLINEKLESRKSELFSEWSEKFFEIFSNSFAKFKNEIIALHLTEEQLKVLTDKLENALLSMQDGLLQINSEFIDEQEELERKIEK